MDWNSSRADSDPPLTLYTLRYSPLWTLTFLVAYLIVFIVGLLGNLLVVIVVLKTREMRSVKNLFILNLGLADLLIIIFCVPPSLFQTIFVPWVLGETYCRYSIFLQAISVASSFYSLVAISTERCLAICLPLRLTIRKITAYKVILVIWIVSILASLPYSMVFRLIKNPDSENGASCLEVWEYPLLRMIFFGVFVTLYLVALLWILGCFLLISHRVFRRGIPPASMSLTLREVHRKSNQSVLRMLLVMILLFFLSWLPYVVVLSWLRINGRPGMGTLDENYLYFSLGISKLFATGNSSLDPIIYNFMNERFQRSFRALFACDAPPGGLRRSDTGTFTLRIALEGRKSPAGKGNSSSLEE